jgi:Flp pilus assembly protein TadB
MISLMISTMLLLILFGVGSQKRERRLAFHRFMLGREAVQGLTAGMKVLERLFPFAAARSTLLLGSLFFIPMLIGFIGLFKHLLWLSIGCFVISLFAPWAGYALRCMWWQRKCRLQMKEGLRLMSTAIRSGRTFVEALQRAALELPFPLRNLWLQAEREVRLGVTEGEAFHPHGIFRLTRKLEIRGIGKKRNPLPFSFKEEVRGSGL